MRKVRRKGKTREGARVRGNQKPIHRRRLVVEV